MSVTDFLFDFLSFRAVNDNLGPVCGSFKVLDSMIDSKVPRMGTSFARVILFKFHFHIGLRPSYHAATEMERS
jgi:hypothetical protein